jgi:putative spermidine/putrescine transport system substrate-binding protein
VFLYSEDGQNLWLKGGARPVRADAMQKSGKLDKTAFDALPAASGTPVFLTDEQTKKAKDYLAANWAKAIS